MNETDGCRGSSVRGMLAPFDPAHLTAGSCWVQRPGERPGDDRISLTASSIHQMGPDKSLPKNFISTPALPGLAGILPVIARQVRVIRSNSWRGPLRPNRMGREYGVHETKVSVCGVGAPLSLAEMNPE